MAELETSDWKDNRRFRVLALHGGQLSFGDFYFRAQQLAGQGVFHSHGGQTFSVAAQEPSAAVGAPLKRLCWGGTSCSLCLLCL